MSAFELNRLCWHVLDGAGYALLYLLKLAGIAAVALSPFLLGWILDGCPSAETMQETFIEDVKGGWR